MRADTEKSGKTAGNELFWVGRRAARLALIVLHLVALAAIVLELLHPFGSDGHGVERVALLEFPGSFAAYGFVACVVLVVLGRLLRRLVMRDENYYGEDE